METAGTVHAAGTGVIITSGDSNNGKRGTVLSFKGGGWYHIRLDDSGTVVKYRPGMFSIFSEAVRSRPRKSPKLGSQGHGPHHSSPQSSGNSPGVSGMSVHDSPSLSPSMAPLQNQLASLGLGMNSPLLSSSPFVSSTPASGDSGAKVTDGIGSARPPSPPSLDLGDTSSPQLSGALQSQPLPPMPLMSLDGGEQPETIQPSPEQMPSSGHTHRPAESEVPLPFIPGTEVLIIPPVGPTDELQVAACYATGTRVKVVDFGDLNQNRLGTVVGLQGCWVRVCLDVLTNANPTNTSLDAAAASAPESENTPLLYHAMAIRSVASCPYKVADKADMKLLEAAIENSHEAEAHATQAALRAHGQDSSSSSDADSDRDHDGELQVQKSVASDGAACSPHVGDRRRRPRELMTSDDEDPVIAGADGDAEEEGDCENQSESQSRERIDWDAWTDSESASPTRRPHATGTARQRFSARRGLAFTSGDKDESNRHNSGHVSFAEGVDSDNSSSEASQYQDDSNDHDYNGMGASGDRKRRQPKSKTSKSRPSSNQTTHSDSDKNVSSSGGEGKRRSGRSYGVFELGTRVKVTDPRFCLQHGNGVCGTIVFFKGGGWYYIRTDVGEVVMFRRGSFDVIAGKGKPRPEDVEASLAEQQRQGPTTVFPNGTRVRITGVRKQTTGTITDYKGGGWYFIRFEDSDNVSMYRRGSFEVIHIPKEKNTVEKTSVKKSQHIKQSAAADSHKSQQLDDKMSARKPSFSSQLDQQQPGASGASTSASSSSSSPSISETLPSATTGGNNPAQVGGENVPVQPGSTAAQQSATDPSKAVDSIAEPLDVDNAPSGDFPSTCKTDVVLTKSASGDNHGAVQTSTYIVSEAPSV